MDSYLERVKALDSLLNTVLKKQDVKQEISDKANKEMADSYNYLKSIGRAD